MAARAEGGLMLNSTADKNEWRGKANIEDGKWTTFVYPEEFPEFFDHMSDVVKVKFMGDTWETGPWIVPNQFPPNTVAERHAHAADTIYVITKGTMTFNDGTGWYGAGDVRWVRANNTYGPEESGPEGCEFILISMGPIDVQWESGETFAPDA
jgi:mannose-6-phosphate isomerase-like protein (cupin superfamily)